MARGALDEACPTVQRALADADLAVVAVPLGALADGVRATLSVAPADCVVTDVGSTKRLVAGIDDERFVGGHPLAGAEASGVQHAREDLFQDAVWYLTPHAGSSGVLFERLHRALAGIGARPAAIEAEAHDRLMAAVSHLPHVLANVLVGEAAGASAGETMPATGPSFRDATRVAGANPELWADILMANADTLVGVLDDALGRLAEVRTALDDGDHAAVLALQTQAASERRALLDAALAGGGRRELRVAVSNRPGVIAEIALALGREHVNISDMALSPSPDNTQGALALWVPDADATRACAIVAALGFPVV